MEKPKRFCEFKRCRGYRKLPGRFEIRINGVSRATCVLCCASVDEQYPNASKRNTILPPEQMTEYRNVSYTNILKGCTLREYFNRIHEIAREIFP